MALSADHPFEHVFATGCSHCEAKKKCSKLQESRNALRQAVKLLETKINEVHAQNVKLNQEYEEERARAKADAEEKLKECNARVSLENKVCSLRSEIDAIRQKPSGDAKNGNESIEGFQACIADKEKEISRLKELLEAEKKKADKEKKNSKKERKKAAEALKAIEVEKSKTTEKEMKIAKVEAEKAEEYRIRLFRLEKEANEAKTKLAHKCERLGIWVKRRRFRVGGLICPVLKSYTFWCERTNMSCFKKLHATCAPVTARSAPREPRQRFPLSPTESLQRRGKFVRVLEGSGT